MVELGPINKFLYGILLTVCIVMMIAYCVWAVMIICDDRDIKIADKWTAIKEAVQKKWYGMKSKIKYSK